MSSLYTGLRGRIYYKKDHIKSGGEGGVYNTGDPNLVLKIYNISKSKSETGLKELEKKIRYMIAHPVPSRLQNGRVIVPWPEDIIYADGQFVGYVMPKVENAKPIFLVNRGGQEARKVIPDYNWKMAVKVASNLAYVVNYLHERDIVIGDMNSDNILVYPDGVVAIIDTDSFDIRDQQTEEHYKCTVGTSEYLPPELQGRNLSSSKAEFTKESDNFALAIHIFQLLMNNMHPFNARVITDYKSSVPESKQDYNISVGNCPFVRKIEKCERPIGAPDMEKLLPENLVRDFKKTFDYQLAVNDPDYVSKLKHQESGRTSAAVWHHDLKALYGNSSLMPCSVNPEHYYLAEKNECAMCYAMKSPQVDDPIDPPKPGPDPKPIWKVVGIALAVLAVLAGLFIVYRVFNENSSWKVTAALINAAENEHEQNWESMTTSHTWWVHFYLEGGKAGEKVKTYYKTKFGDDEYHEPEEKEYYDAENGEWIDIGRFHFHDPYGVKAGTWTIGLFDAETDKILGSVSIEVIEGSNSQTGYESFDIMSGADFETKQYEDGSSLIYLKTDHFVLKMPYFNDGNAHWDLKEADNKQSFQINCTDCTKDNYSGNLVTIRAYDFGDSSYKRLPKYCVIGDSTSKRYIAIYPTDVQYNSDDREQVKYYSALSLAVKELDPNGKHQWEIAYPMMEILD